MIPRLLPTSALALIALLPAQLLAQADTSAREDARMDALMRGGGNDGRWFSPRGRLNVGFRVLSSGGKVDFGNLGSVPFQFPIVAASEGAKNRGYNDGAVVLDALRADEKNADGNQTSTPGGRYQVFGKDANGNPRLTGEFLAYTPELTREWDVRSQSQVLDTPGYVAFHSYAAVSEGASARKEQGATGGVELQFSRELSRGSRHFRWGVAAGIALNDINSKTSGTVVSTLRSYTDYYSTNGLTVPAEQLSNPFAVSTTDLNGDGFLDVNELTVPINVAPEAGMTTDVLQAGGASVTGRWQVKGAYFMIKLGPTLRTQITDRFGVTASVGLAGAYAGTRYSATESFSVSALPDEELTTLDPETGDSMISSTESKFLTGYYADLNLEWDANEVFGLFGGVTAQQMSSYDQKLGDRTAKIDLGSAVGIRGGVSVRF